MNKKQLKPNNLINETSPYLLQHAYNPVNWHAWNEESLQKAIEENKPIFLSIGYSTCHWCHVMEKESFEDLDVARLLNDSFICIKVDREERPDLDSIYMSVSQIVNGAGGWPLNLVLTPDKKPYFVDTYIPKNSKYFKTGLIELIPHLNSLWKNERQKVLNIAEDVTRALKNYKLQKSEESIDLELSQMGFEDLFNIFDENNGGFGRAPKFPMPHNLIFLLRYWKRTNNNHALFLVEKTLSKIRKGGIFDHIGFGIHRYSTDTKWLVPHFEKMLYDQALLAMAYCETFQATRNQQYAKAAEEIFSYVLRDLRNDEGGFFAGEDADSDGEEGKFYLWNTEELKNLLTSREFEVFCKTYNIQAEGNYYDEATRRKTGNNIPHLTTSHTELAASLNLQENELTTILESSRKKLLKHRNNRIKPQKDDKILTDWNSLMIASLAIGYKMFNKKEYLNAAKDGINFIFNNLYSDKGLLSHCYCKGKTLNESFLDDYSFLIFALIELYEATFNPEYLIKAVDLNNQLLEYYWDNKTGGFYFTSKASNEILIRKKEYYDGAIPSGNSIAVYNLLRLARLTSNPKLEEYAHLSISNCLNSVKRLPSAFTQLLISVEFALGKTYEIVISGNLFSNDTLKLINSLKNIYLPNKTILFRPENFNESEIANIAPSLENLTSLNDSATAYICESFGCRQPLTDTKEIISYLN